MLRSVVGGKRVYRCNLCGFTGEYFMKLLPPLDKCLAGRRPRGICQGRLREVKKV